MGDIINLENIKNEKEYDYTTYNHNYFSMLHRRIEKEVNAIAKGNNPDNTNMAKTIADMTTNFVDSVEEMIFSTKTSAADVKGDLLLASIMRNVNTLLNGGIISPITGDADEWIDVTKEEDKGKPFKVEYLGKEIEVVNVDTLEVNVRYPRIFRFNRDNNYAHRIDYIQFRDVKNFGSVYLNADSIRFIQFPYRMDEVHIPAVIGENNEIIDYIDYDIDEVAEGIIYPAENTEENKDGYVVAPKIPFSLLEKYGINIKNEVDKFISKNNE